jgi:predicted HTH domain antitoxin
LAIATKVRRAARRASTKESNILQDLVMYYKGECSLGYIAKKLNMPLRALMEFMMRNKLPQYWQKEDGEIGLSRLAELSTVK